MWAMMKIVVIFLFSCVYGQVIIDGNDVGDGVDGEKVHDEVITPPSRGIDSFADVDVSLEGEENEEYNELIRVPRRRQGHLLGHVLNHPNLSPQSEELKQQFLDELRASSQIASLASAVADKIKRLKKGRPSRMLLPVQDRSSSSIGMVQPATLVPIPLAQPVPVPLAQAVPVAHVYHAPVVPIPVPQTPYAIPSPYAVPSPYAIPSPYAVPAYMTKQEPPCPIQRTPMAYTVPLITPQRRPHGSLHRSRGYLSTVNNVQNTPGVQDGIDQEYVDPYQASTTLLRSYANDATSPTSIIQNPSSINGRSILMDGVTPVDGVQTGVVPNLERVTSGINPTGSTIASTVPNILQTGSLDSSQIYQAPTNIQGIIPVNRVRVTQPFQPQYTFPFITPSVGLQPTGTFQTTLTSFPTSINSGSLGNTAIYSAPPAYEAPTSNNQANFYQPRPTITSISSNPGLYDRAPTAVASTTYTVPSNTYPLTGGAVTPTYNSLTTELPPYLIPNYPNGGNYYLSDGRLTQPNTAQVTNQQ